MYTAFRLLMLCLMPFVLWPDFVSAGQKEFRLLFTGDILLSRNVALEIEKRGISPWSHLNTLFGHADLVVGNLEGAVGKPEGCIPSREDLPCFSIPELLVPLLASAGFKVLSIENNHSNDLGEKGSDSTRETLRASGLEQLSFDGSPRFFQLGDISIAMIAVNLVPGRDGQCQSIPSVELRQKLRLARKLANLVVVSVHWGSELLDWPNDKQRKAAQWLVKQGADLIIGHHPHVVQSPEMVGGKPVFFSLGNHLFDQKYLATKEGMIADCGIAHGMLRCQGLPTHTAKGSFFPELAESEHHDVQPTPLREPIHISGLVLSATDAASDKNDGVKLEARENGKYVWQTGPIRLAAIAAARLDGKHEYLFTLERHYSPIDREVGLRPYVYSVTRHGLVARWRGSALAWPLLDAMILPDDDTIVCGLHRGDSFIDLQPDSKRVRVAAYRWNGFGFSGVDAPEVVEKCRRCLEVEGDTGEPAP